MPDLGQLRRLMEADAIRIATQRHAIEERLREIREKLK